MKIYVLWSTGYKDTYPLWYFTKSEIAEKYRKMYDEDNPYDHCRIQVVETKEEEGENVK